MTLVDSGEKLVKALRPRENMGKALDLNENTQKALYTMGDVLGPTENLGKTSWLSEKMGEGLKSHYSMRRFYNPLEN